MDFLYNLDISEKEIMEMIRNNKELLFLDDEKIKEVNDRITEVASGGLKPLEMATYRTFFDNLVITADGYVEPQP